MHRRFFASALAIALVASCAIRSPDAPSIFRADAGPVAGEERSLARRAGATPGASLEAAARARELGALTERLDPALAATPWSLEGPHNIGGRVVDLVLDPQTPNLLYVATAGGGVWRSTDAGVTFEPAWPHDLTQSMGALAVSADGELLYAGTGEANPGGGSLTYPGTGVYRSRDGGRTWKHAGLGHSARIGRLAVDPRDHGVVLAAVAGDLFTPGGVRGIYRSEDAGRTWTRTLRGANDTTGGIDVVVDPTNPDRVFAALWDHRREPHVRRYEGPGSSIWRSLDGGVTWTRLTAGLPGDDPPVGRIGLAVSSLVPGIVYADIVGEGGRLRGVYASIDGGNTWTRKASVGAGGSTYEWWFGRIWVDPLDPLHLFRGSVDLQESLDGGDTWVPHTWLVAGLTGAPALHADHHAMVWDPVVPGRVFLGNDGGVYVGSLVPGGGWVKGGDQPWTQFYSVDVAEDDPSRIVGGAQDNGVLRSFRYTGRSPEGWNRYVGGDGEAALISPANHDNVYGCSQYGVCARSTTAGEVMSGMSGGGVYNWFSPLEFDPSDPAVMYWGSTVVRRSHNGGATWIPISPPLPRATESNGGYPFGTITTIAVSPADPSTLLAGTDDGAVWIRAAGAQWADVSAGLPGLWVSRVAFDPTDTQVAYVTMSGYRAGDGGAHVYRTEDAGATWRPIGAPLPEAPVNDLVPTPHGLLAATDVGVFVTADPSAAEPVWLRVGDGLPLAPTTDIRYHAPTDAVYAATFGRGIWKVSL